jgi:predicted ABC-type ATPase
VAPLASLNAVRTGTTGGHREWRNPCSILLAGPNGAGKSTLNKASVAEGLIPRSAPLVNADLREAAALAHMHDPLARSRAARAWADAERAQCLNAGQSFVSETVFSHTSRLDLIAAAQRAGFAVVLLVVCVDDPQMLLARVAQWVEEGGHPVPPVHILARYPRTVRQLSVACAGPTWSCCTTPRYRQARPCSRLGWWRSCAKGW